MSTNHRTTISLDTDIYRALRLKAATTGTSLSALINEAVRISLAEDLEDLEALEARVNEPSIPFEELLKEMADAGKL
jgi:hypothetical protein